MMLGAWYDFLLPGQAILLRDQAAVAAAAEVEAQKKDIERRVATTVTAKAKALQPEIEAAVAAKADAAARAGAVDGASTVFYVVGAGLLLWLLLKR